MNAKGGLGRVRERGSGKGKDSEGEEGGCTIHMRTVKSNPPNTARKKGGGMGI
jgi:hypothetical protein